MFFNVLLLAGLVSSAPTVYLIRHGEKPDSGTGLSIQGMQRAQCLRTVFGAFSGYDIGHIMAQTPKADGSRGRPLATVQPLAADLGLRVDTSCDRDDEKCVSRAVKHYRGPGNILICWEHKQLNDIADSLGAKNATEYPGDHFDLIWTDPSPYTAIDVSSEDCPGLDS